LCADHLLKRFKRLVHRGHRLPFFAASSRIARRINAGSLS
jgi:hypothetical protein